MAFKPKYKKSVSKPTLNNVTVDEIDMDNIFDPEKIYDQLMSLREYQEAGEVKTNKQYNLDLSLNTTPITDRGNFSKVVFTEPDQRSMQRVVAYKKNIEEKKLQEEISARQAKEKGTIFTLPTGISKKYKDMSFKEREYVDAQSLRNKSRWNENEVKQPFLNTFNPITQLYDMAAGLAEAPLMSDVTDSAIPYVTGIGTPLLMGRMMGSGSINPLGKKFWTNEVSNKEFLNTMGLGVPGLAENGFKLGNRFLRKKPFISENVDLKLWNIFNKKKPKPFLPPSLNAESELARANADALAFSQSPYNKTKLQEFRPNQDFNVTNTEALFHNDPVAREKFAKLMNDDSDFLKYRNIENWQGVSEGNYGARYFGDINDVAIVNKNKPQSKIYNAAIHETGHSRSVRLPATNKEREILDDAWKGLKQADGSSLSPLEAEAVQGELRMLLGDKLGKRVFTKVDEGEIKTALKKMIADNHPYVQSINDFDVSKIIKSLNKIGLASIVGVEAGLLNEKKYGGTIPQYQLAGQYKLDLTPNTRAGFESQSTKTSKPISTKQNLTNVLTYQSNPDYFDSHTIIHPDNKYNEQIKKSIYSGQYGYNPKTQQLIKLDKPVYVDPATREMATKEWGMKSDTERFASKTPAGEYIRKVNVSNDLNKIVRNPITYAPGVIAAGALALPATATAATSALSAPAVIGSTTIPWLTPGSMLGAGFGLYEANNLANDINTGYYTSNAPMLDKVSTGLMRGVGLLGMPGAVEGIGSHLINPAYRGSIELANYLKNNPTSIYNQGKGIILANRFNKLIDKTNLNPTIVRPIQRLDLLDNYGSVGKHSDIHELYKNQPKQYESLLNQLFNNNANLYTRPLIRFKNVEPQSFVNQAIPFTNPVNEGRLFKEKICPPGSECAKTANSLNNYLFKELTGLPFEYNANAHNAWHMEHQMTRHGGANVTPNIIIGDRLLMGNGVNQSTYFPGAVADPRIRHAGVYAGDAIIDGNRVPMVFESGSNAGMYLNPIDYTFTGPNTVLETVRPAQHLQDDYLRSLVNKNIRYAYRDKPSIYNTFSNNQNVQHHLDLMNSHREEIKKTYDLTNDEFDQIRNSLIGIGAQETKLGRTLPGSKLSKNKILVQDILEELQLTNPIKKVKGSIGKTINQLTKTNSNLPAYPGSSYIEKEAALLSKENNISFEQALNTIKKQYQPKPLFSENTTTASRGLFRQKLQTKEDLLANVDSYDYHRNALGQMAKNLNTVKKLYPGATPSQLVDLTTLMWNSPGKAANRELVDFYLMGLNNPNPAKFKFDYINKINSYKNQLLENPINKAGRVPHFEFFGPQGPEIYYKKGGQIPISKNQLNYLNELKNKIKKEVKKNVNKYQRGGQTNPPIYVSNVNDPRLKSYTDSLNAYIQSINLKNKVEKTKQFPNPETNGRTTFSITGESKSMLPKTALERMLRHPDSDNFNNFTKYNEGTGERMKPIDILKYPSDKWYSLEAGILPIFAEPVQPIIYKNDIPVPPQPPIPPSSTHPINKIKRLPNIGNRNKITIQGTPINYSPNVFIQPQTNIPTQRGVSGGWQIINGEWKRVPYNTYQQGGETNYYPPKEVMINEGSSYYNPSSEIVYINPNDKRDNTDASRQHELFHHYQNINGNLQLPQFYNGPLKRPNMMMNQDIQSAYYNRGNVDEALMYNQMIQENPDWQFMPRDLLYKGYQLQSGRYVPGTSDMLYQTPWTAEGESQRYENDVRNGMNPLFKNGGYTVVRSNDRKGKTHKVTGPDGTVKYFGDSKLGQHPNDPERKKAFYARHKKNLANNPYFRAFARKTWKEGGSVTLNAGGEKHRIYVKPTNAGEGVKGHIMVNHPTMDKGMWDTIDLTQKAGATTIAQGVAATKKWHMENPYEKQKGGNVYWRTGQPMVNDPSMDAISKVLLYRNQDKNFMQRAAGFGYQGGIPTKYIEGQDPESINTSSLLMSSSDNYVYPTIIQTAPSQLSYQPNQTNEYINTPSWDVADYFATKGYKRAANDMYKMNYAQGGEMIKRADGSYSRRGLWDNIRENRGSGKKPTKQMLQQERKIKNK